MNHGIYTIKKSSFGLLLNLCLLFSCRVDAPTFMTYRIDGYLANNRSCLDENEAFLTTADSLVKLLEGSTKPVTGWKGIEYKVAFPLVKPPGANFYPLDMNKKVYFACRRVSFAISFELFESGISGNSRWLTIFILCNSWQFRMIIWHLMFYNIKILPLWLDQYHHIHLWSKKDMVNYHI